MRGRKLHVFAYLADVLSPVWNLQPFDGKVLKIQGGPHYPDLQSELDRLAVMGIVVISRLKYFAQRRATIIVDADYAVNFESPQLDPILAALGSYDAPRAFDPHDFQIQLFLVDLAGAIATLS